MLQFLTAADPAVGGSMTSFIITIIAMIAIFYFMLIRPENKRKKEAEELRNSLKVGDEIVTIGGITGKVVNVKEDRFVIETGADQVRIEFVKWALSTNETSAARTKEDSKKREEEKAKAKAAKKAKKQVDDKA